MKPLYKNKAWLEEMYIERELTLDVVAEKCGVSAGSIGRALTKHGIPKRGSNWIRADGLHYSARMGLINDKEWLHEQYVVKGRTLYNISEESGCCPQTVRNRAVQFGIPIRPIGGAPPEALSGEQSPSWKGGLPNCLDCGKRLSEYRGVLCKACRSIRKRGSGGARWKGIADIDRSVRMHSKTHWRPKILKRDDGQCRHCGSKENIEVHHIEGLKDIIDRVIRGMPTETASQRETAIERLRAHPDVMSLDNGLTLCVGCHRNIGVKN